MKFGQALAARGSFVQIYQWYV